MTVSMGDPTIDLALNGIIAIIAWLFSGMIGFAVPWFVFKIDAHNHVHDSNGHFTSGGKVVGLILAGIIITGIINAVCSAIFQAALETYLSYLVAITLTTFMAFTVWISYTFHANLRPYWKIFALLILIVALNIIAANWGAITQAITNANH